MMSLKKTLQVFTRGQYNDVINSGKFNYLLWKYAYDEVYNKRLAMSVKLKFNYKIVQLKNTSVHKGSLVLS